MTHPANGIVAALILFVAAIPYVARIRHPEQKPFAAYLIFVSVFGVASAVLFGVFTAAASALGLSARLEQTVPALVFLLLVFMPALLLARWQARKPPWRQGTPP
jgi:hypothetical protein